jgi:hypothetical protein
VDEGLAGLPELAPGCEHRHTRANGTPDLGNPSCRECADLRRAEARTGIRNDIAFANVSASRANVLT